MGFKAKQKVKLLTEHGLRPLVFGDPHHGSVAQAGAVGVVQGHAKVQPPKDDPEHNHFYTVLFDNGDQDVHDSNLESVGA